MSGQLPVSKHTLLAFLCCLVPLAALAAVLFLNTPIVPVALLAAVLLVPLARWLLRTSWNDKS